MAKQKSGLYRTKIVVGHDADGTPIVRWISGRTKKELEQHRQEALRCFVLGVEDRRDVMFEAYLREWYEVYKEPSLSESSKRCYAAMIEKHIAPSFRGKQLRSVSAADVQRFINGFAGRGKSTIGYAASVLTNVFRHAYANGVIPIDPTRALKKPSAEKQCRRALTADEAAAALQVGREHPEGLLLLLLYYTGLRRGEALGLQWQDIDFKRRTISVSRDIDFVTGAVGALKTKYSHRTLPIPDDLLTALDAIRGVGETYVIQAPRTHSYLSQRTFSRRWDRLIGAMVDAGAESARELTPHFFRHNYASVLYNAGVDILAAQRFLGHADIKTTLSIYAHLSEGKELESAEKVRKAFAEK